MRTAPGLYRFRQPMALVVAGVVAALVVGALALFIELRRRHNLYWYDVRQDYDYSFTGAGVSRLQVDVSREGFTVPAAQGSWDTALLRLRVESSATARWFEPSVVVEADGRSHRQFFERGARGTRYLLLPRAASPGTAVRLRGDRLHWPLQEAELLLFDSGTAPSPTVLVLAPHPDDAEIAAFGLYATHHAYVATVTAGNYVHESYAHLAADDAAQNVLRARIRTWHALAVPAWGGVPPERIVTLGYAGLSLEHLFETRERSTREGNSTWPIGRYRQGAVQQMLRDRAPTETWDSLVHDLTALLDTTRPDVIVAPHPVLDGSADHQLTTIALFEALEAGADDSTTLFLYTNHHILAEYYPFGPSDSVVTLPPWFDPALPFGSIYSFDVDPEQQIDKLLALEAHHDLRPPPRRLLGGPGDRFWHRVGQGVGDLVRDPVSDYSYYRRAIRPNEVFFVYGPAERRVLSAAVGSAGRTIQVKGLR
jgi:LmbE family N-acetylglucosaminyl deacetylase